MLLTPPSLPVFTDDDYDMNNSDPGRGRGHNRSNQGTYRGSVRRGQAKYHATRGRYSSSPVKREVHFENSTGDNVRRRLGLRRSTGSIRGRLQARSGGQAYSPKDDPENQWYRVEIPHGTKSDRNVLIRTISASMDTELRPFNYHTEGNFVVFSVLGKEVADTLSSLSKRITKPDGFKIVLIVKPSTPPVVTLDSSIEATIKDVMAKRYNANSKFLDLSNFRKDPDFISRELYISLERPNILSVVSRMIQENVPDLAVLNLGDNRLKFLDKLSPISSICQNLKAVNLSKNMITNLAELDHISQLQLIELCLEGNPCCAYKDKSSFISSIRSKFPKIIKLDGEDLPAVIGFEVEESLPIPLTLPSHLPEDVAKFATDFVAQFYTLYDSSDRQKLIEGYHEQASFSFSVMKSPEREQPTAPFPRELIEESRNLTRLTSPEGRNKLLRIGKVAVVAAINSLPETTHIKESLMVDVPFYSNVLVNIVVSGLFVEVWRRQKQTRSFTRTFLIVPQEGGYFIVNDIFMVGNSTHCQRQKYPAPRVSSSSTPGGSSGDSDDSVSLIARLTGMNIKMSKQLLDESNLSVETALTMFKELNDRGAIPDEAFK